MVPIETSHQKLYRVRQRFPRPFVKNIPLETERQLQTLQLSTIIQPGESVAITAGSRGIANIADILAAVVKHFHSLQAKPFLVPAMGSHGGATAEGQLAVLKRLGISEASCGCPIRSSMKTTVVLQSSYGFPIHTDQNTLEADHVFLVNRVKPHTRFVGAIQSGLCKMLLVGLGKQQGAENVHAAESTTGFGKIVESIVPTLAQKIGVCGGLAIVENAYDETMLLKAIGTDNLLVAEATLLKKATAWMPRLPFNEIDLLIVDEIGKEISGSGLDTIVVGRKSQAQAPPRNNQKDLLFPNIKKILACRLTKLSHGNAMGIGYCDAITQELLDAIDTKATEANCKTTGHPAAAAIPPVFANVATAITALLAELGISREEAKTVCIQNTLKLSEIYCSEAFRKEVQQRDYLEIVS